MASLAHPMPHDDAFPSTNAEWLHQELDAGEERRRALRTVVMARYFEPLRIYVKGSSYRHLGESAELVSAFFVSRFARDDYLDAWRESRMTLRRWLINGLILSMREEVRRRRRAAKRGMQQTHEAPPKRGGISATSPPGRITAYGGSETGAPMMLAHSIHLKCLNHLSPRQSPHSSARGQSRSSERPAKRSRPSATPMARETCGFSSRGTSLMVSPMRCSWTRQAMSLRVPQ